MTKDTLQSFVYVALVACILVCQWNIGNKNPLGWLWCIPARIALIGWSFWMGTPGATPIFLTFIVCDWRNYRKWRTDEDRVRAISHAYQDDPAAFKPDL